LKLNIINLSNIYFLLIAFPYVTFFIPTISDLQPYGLIFSFLIFMFYLIVGKKISFPPIFLMILLVFFYSLFLFFIKSNFILGLRSIANYASYFFITFAAYKLFKYIKVKYFFLAVYVWFFFGIVQTFFVRNFGSVFLNRISTSISRGAGVTSLAVEPSYYAIICVNLLILNDLFFSLEYYQKKKYIFIFMILSIQIGLSLSGMGLVFFSIYLLLKIVAYYLFNKVNNLNKLLIKILKLILFIFIVILLFYTIYNGLFVFENSRPTNILKSLINTKKLGNFLKKDASVALRMSHILLSFSSIRFSNGIGFGLGTWQENFSILISNSGKFISNLYNVRPIIGSKPMSGWGGIIFELGIIGVIPILFFVFISAKSFIFRSDLRGVILINFIIQMLLVAMALPFGFPLFHFINGILIFLYHNKYFKNSKIKSGVY